ncbi:hypothetical protein ACVGWN_01560, partial [Enterobacter hormaechei]
FSPNAANARVRYAAILARSQIFTPDAVLPVVLPLNIRGSTVQTVMGVYPVSYKQLRAHETVLLIWVWGFLL